MLKQHCVEFSIFYILLRMCVFVIITYDQKLASGQLCATTQDISFS